MGSNEIFYSLTRGVHFKKRKLEEDEKSHDKFSSKKFKKEFEDIVDKNEIEIFNKQRKAHEANEKTPKKEKQFLQGFLVKNTKLNDFRKKNKINVAGKRIPKAIQNFEALQVDYEVPKILIDNLNCCGFYVPTPVQMQATPVMLKGRNVMACAPTGSGKTVAFLIPIIRDLRVHQKKGFRCIILCPTRELAQQTYRETLRLTEKTGLKTHIISKVKKLEENYDLKFNNKYDILISTPNRVRFLLQFHPPKIDLSNIEWFIIDEADRLLEDGKNSFKEQFDDIWNACSNTSKKMGLFSATYTTQVAKWALRNLKQLVRITIGERNSATSLVDQELFFVGSESGKLLAIRNMIQNGLKPPVLIFVQSKDRAQQLLSELLYDGINVDVIHADRSQQQRDNVVKAFREGKIWVLICTELMSREQAELEEGGKQLPSLRRRTNQI
ncbi:DEAD box protein 52 homolog isoform X2 [Condylostylus longicornis]|uniref:DEAD box protein 52 homolog isoform X2 n=1 Tax=Condylostylus longicornis TaxID=2530218 RepID=UPI00244E4634|nr:DEAD box protein 52 homolog isoform X2 [Condylostylus longicornis]